MYRLAMSQIARLTSFGHAASGVFAFMYFRYLLTNVFLFNLGFSDQICDVQAYDVKSGPKRCVSHHLVFFLCVFFFFFFFFDTNNVFFFCNLGSNENRICSQVGSGSGPGPTPRAGPPSSWPWPLPTRGRANNIWPGPSDLPVGSGPVRGPQGPGPDRGQSRCVALLIFLYFLSLLIFSESPTY